MSNEKMIGDVIKNIIKIFEQEGGFGTPTEQAAELVWRWNDLTQNHILENYCDFTRPEEMGMLIEAIMPIMQYETGHDRNLFIVSPVVLDQKSVFLFANWIDIDSCGYSFRDTMVAVPAEEFLKACEQGEIGNGNTIQAFFKERLPNRVDPAPQKPKAPENEP